MALTVTGLSDSGFYPANNDMFYTLSSTNTAQANFRYIADIYINGASTYNRIEVVAHPTYSSGVVDISGIVQSYLTSNPEDNTTTFLISTFLAHLLSSINNTIQNRIVLNVINCPIAKLCEGILQVTVEEPVVDVNVTPINSLLKSKGLIS